MLFTLIMPPPILRKTKPPCCYKTGQYLEAPTVHKGRTAKITLTGGLMRFGNYALVAGCVVASVMPAARGAEPIRPEQFRTLHTLIKPKAAEEKWEQIPWLASLWEARQ